MTEQEWLHTAYVDQMLPVVFSQLEPSKHKIRLLCYYCLRKNDPPGSIISEAIACLGGYLDGTASYEEASSLFYEVIEEHPQVRRLLRGVFPRRSKEYPDAREVLEQVSCVAEAIRVGRNTEKNWQKNLIREMFGNPFRPVTVDPVWRTTDVISLAQAAYDERQLPSGHLELDRLAILADALEDAGCACAELIGHLRSPGPHVRGCWAVDLVLGNQ